MGPGDFPERMQRNEPLFPPGLRARGCRRPPPAAQECPQETRGEAAGSAQQHRAACLGPGSAGEGTLDGPRISEPWSDASRTHTPEIPLRSAQGTREAGQDAETGECPRACWAPENPSSIETPSPGVVACFPLLPDEPRRTQHLPGLRHSLELASSGCSFSGMRGELSSGKAAQSRDAAAPWPGSVPAQSVLPSPGAPGRAGSHTRAGLCALRVGSGGPR